MEREYALYAVEQTQQLLAIDSPSGFTAAAAQWVLSAFSSLGYSAHITRKGGVLIDLGGQDAQDALLLEPTPTPWAQWWLKSRATAACA